MKKPEFQRLRIKIIMEGLQVFGVITVPINGYRSRLSDLLNNNQDFLALTDVEIYRDEELVEKTPFMCINKHAIMFLSETEDVQSPEIDHVTLQTELNYNRSEEMRAIA